MSCLVAREDLKVVESPSLQPRTPPCGLHALEPVQYKVLLQNLPKTMGRELLLVLLMQAKLEDVTDLAFRSDGSKGKALITFTTSDSIRKCCRIFHGLFWDSSSGQVSASFVRTVKSTDLSTAASSPQLPVKTSLCADATVFVGPEKLYAKLLATKKFSATAPTRVCSSRSTDEGFASDDESDSGNSETEALRHWLLPAQKKQIAF
jgi:hypothetical protein